MSQDHRSPLPRPSHEDSWNDGTADRPAYPPTPPVRPSARWGSRRLSGGAPAPDSPGHGLPTTPAHGRPASPLRGHTAPDTGHPSPAGPGRFGPPSAHSYGAPTPESFGGPTPGGFGAPTSEGFGAPTPGGFGAPTPESFGGPTPGGFGAPTSEGFGAPPPGGLGAPAAGGLGGPGGAGRFAPPEAPGRGSAARISGLGATAAPVRGASAPAYPATSRGYRAPDTGRYAAAGPPPASWSSGATAEPTIDGHANQAVHHQIRQAVVHRVQYANALHASHYWDLRRTSPVGPHALVFLYASLDPRFADPRRPYYEIRAASRLFRDGSEVQDLPALLAELCEIAEGYLAGGGVFDPVAQMTQAGEPMPAEARYVGVSVSTLLGGGSGGSGGPELPGVGGMGIPGRNLVVMSDDNLLVVERPARAHEQVEVNSTCPHFSGGGVEVRSWLPLTPEQQVDPAWRALQHLNRLVLAGQERKAATVASTGGRRRH